MRGKVLEMRERVFRVRLWSLRGESFVDDVVGALDEQFDASFGIADDDGHSAPSGSEFQHVENLVDDVTTVDRHHHRVGEPLGEDVTERRREEEGWGVEGERKGEGRERGGGKKRILTKRIGGDEREEIVKEKFQ